MKQLIQVRKYILSVMVFSLYPLYAQADALQKDVFDTIQGFFPSDYIQAYPAGSEKCQDTGSVSGYKQEFHHSGSALETFSDGSGVVYQAMYAPYLTAHPPTEGVTWAGDLRAMMIDELGRWRSDNGDNKLGSLQEDPLVTSCFDADANITRFSLSKTSSHARYIKCNKLHYPKEESDLGYLWKSDEELAKMTQLDVPLQRYPFQSKSHQRFIRTHIEQQEYDFIGTEDFPFQPEWFGLSSAEKAAQLIGFIRGGEYPEWRRRTLEQHIYRLGDPLNAEPVYVARPAANFHLLYDDASYQAFLSQYRTRRSRVFLNTNDGILHAFNAGWFDPVRKEILKAPPAPAGLAQWDLGQEIWAFVPFDVLPLLTQRAEKSYGRQGQEHLNISSQTPYIFDARIFKYKGSGGIEGQADRLFESVDGTVISHLTHPGGWGTIMVTGVGGGAFATENSLGSSQLYQPGYLVFDITDAEQAPKLLAYIRHPSLGSSQTQPGVITRKNTQGELQWYLVLGSGADLDPASMRSLLSRQSAKLILYNLNTLERDLKKGGEVIDLGLPASIVAGMSSADWRMDGMSDALYIGVTGSQGSPPNHQWRSALLRITAEKQGGWHRQNLLSLNAPLSYRPQLSVDPLGNRWVYLATGRVFSGDGMPGSIRNSIVGLKEARNISGGFHMDMQVKGSALNLSDLLSVGGLKVNPLNGDLDGPVNISPALPRKNVQDLEQRLLQYTQASEYISGWHRALDHGEVASGQSSVYGGWLSQSTYQSKSGQGACQKGGKSFVHQLRFTTGTAWFDERKVGSLSDPNASKPHASLIDTRSELSGSGSLANFLLQVVDGKKRARLLVSGQHGALDVQELSLADFVTSGEISWREL